MGRRRRCCNRTWWGVRGGLAMVGCCAGCARHSLGRRRDTPFEPDRTRNSLTGDDALVNIVPSDHPRRSSYQAGLAVTDGKDQPGVITCYRGRNRRCPAGRPRGMRPTYAVRAGHDDAPPGHLRGHGGGGLRRYAHEDGTGNGGVADGGTAHAAAACRCRRDGHSEGVCRAPGRAAVAEGAGCPQGPDLHRRLHHADGRRVLLADARPAAAVLAWEQAHLPRRFTPGDADFGPPSWDRTFSLSPIPGVLNARDLVVEVTGAANGQTAIRVDAQVSWQPARRPSNGLPSRHPRGSRSASCPAWTRTPGDRPRRAGGVSDRGQLEAVDERREPPDDRQVGDRDRGGRSPGVRVRLGSWLIRDHAGGGRHPFRGPAGPAASSPGRPPGSLFARWPLRSPRPPGPGRSARRESEIAENVRGSHDGARSRRLRA